MRKILLLSVMLGGCAVQLTDKAANIQVHNQMSTLLTGCKNIGPVNTDAEDILMGRERATMMAKVKLREMVADKGGDTLVLLNADNLSETKVALQGTAMKCY